MIRRDHELKNPQKQNPKKVQRNVSTSLIEEVSKVNINIVSPNLDI